MVPDMQMTAIQMNDGNFYWETEEGEEKNQ